MENHFDKDNSLHEHRGDRPEGMALEPRPANSDIHAGTPLAVRGRTEDPAQENRESRLLLRCAYSKARADAASQADLSADPRGQLPGSGLRIIWESWRITQSQFRYREIGVVDLGNLDG